MRLINFQSIPSLILLQCILILTTTIQSARHEVVAFTLTSPPPSTPTANKAFTKVSSTRTTRTSLHSITNGDDTTDTTHQEEEVDRAPCFDSICTAQVDVDAQVNINTDTDTDTDFTTTPTTPATTTDPIKASISSPGIATQRLGLSSTPTVWSEFGRIAEANKESISNLGQGFPDWLPPKFAIESLVEAVTDVSTTSPHQYTRTAGHVNLVKELAERYSVHLERRVDAMGEVAVTVGASQALYLSLQTLIQPGDEVIVFEPFFDLYVNQIKLAGGIPVYVPLTFQPYPSSSSDNNNDNNIIQGGEWVLDPTILQSKITSNTRAIILNSPHNPTGKIFTKSEMMNIATIVERDAPLKCVVLSDEVYKYIVHSPPKDDNHDDNDDDDDVLLLHDNDNDTTNGDLPKKSKLNKPTSTITSPGHTHFATLPNMSERTITISSAGKTFSATGWQVGWAIGPKHLISPIHQLLPYVQFCAPTVIQEALARTLPKADEEFEGFASYYDYLKAMYTTKRDLLGTALHKAGFGIPNFDKTPGGGFFIFARIGPEIQKSIPKERLNVPNVAAPGGVAQLDWALCQWMAEEKGVLCIPASPFFSEEKVRNGEAAQFVRIAFCKTDETIHAAADALLKIQQQEEQEQGQQGDNNGDDEVVVVDEDGVNGSKSMGMNGTTASSTSSDEENDVKMKVNGSSSSSLMGEPEPSRAGG